MKSGYPRRSSNVFRSLEGKPLSWSSAGLHSYTSFSPKCFEKCKVKNPEEIVGTECVISRIISLLYWYSSTSYLIPSRNQRQKAINQQSSIHLQLEIPKYWDTVVILPLLNYMIFNNYSVSLSPHLFSQKELYWCLTHPTIFFSSTNKFF